MWRNWSPCALLMGGKMVQSLWKTVFPLPEKLKTELAFHFCRYTHQKLKERNTYTLIFTTALFTIAKK